MKSAAVAKHAYCEFRPHDQSQARNGEYRAHKGNEHPGQLLARVIGAAPTDSHEARIAALASTLASVGITDPAALAALAGMLAIELPPDPSAPPLSAQSASTPVAAVRAGRPRVGNRS